STNNLFSLTITPSRYEFLLSPGEKIKGYYLVTNDTDKPQIITVSIKDWFISEWNKDISCQQWLKINSKKKFVLQPKENKKVIFTAITPINAKGALFSMITVNSIDVKETGLNIALSVPVILIIKGTEKYDAEIKNLKFKIFNNELQVSLDVINKGNVHLRPKGTCKISNDETTLIIELPEIRPVYPGMTRTIFGSKSIQNIPDGKYTCEINIFASPLEFIKKTQIQVETNTQNIKQISELLNTNNLDMDENQ
ncbi:MAG: hypothetical protein NZ839_03900, partial [Endomicrobia bacterium]|nr:hypothetical protein [Endomicrobiia bacterium]